MAQEDATTAPLAAAPAGTTPTAPLDAHPAHDPTAERLRRRRMLWIALPSAALLLLLIAAIGGYVFNWKWTGFHDNTLWDWMNLLFIPLAIGIAGIAFNLRQTQNSLRANAEQRAEATCEAYLDHISRLLVDANLREAPPESAIRQVARARTLATIRRVGPEHRTLIHRFLDDAGLLAGESPILTDEDMAG